MLRVPSIAALALAALMLALGQSRAEPSQSPEASVETVRAATARLHALGYPADTRIAIQRWRTDTGRTGAGPLTPEESAAVLAHPMPQFFAAFAGNPFQGMGIAVRHKTPGEAEAQARTLCRRQGGGAACGIAQVIPGGQCMFVSGYVGHGERRPSRGSWIVAPSMELARSTSLAHCRKGAGPALADRCAPLASFCADGSQMDRTGPNP